MKFVKISRFFLSISNFFTSRKKITAVAPLISNRLFRIHRLRSQWAICPHQTREILVFLNTETAVFLKFFPKFLGHNFRNQVGNVPTKAGYLFYNGRI